MLLRPSAAATELESAWVFLNITDPQVAWLVYRGEMVSAQQTHEIALSSWTARYLADARTDTRRRTLLEAELQLEQVRQTSYRNPVSRLTGFYLFPDEEIARRAMSEWDGRGFREEHLAEVGIHPQSRISRYDAEWISRHLAAAHGTAWMSRYLSGEPLGAEPLWELVVDGRAFIYGTELRDAAYEVVKATWHRSLALLELARIGSELGSDLGLTTAMVVGEPGRRRVVYAMSMEDANDPEFLERFESFQGPVNRADLAQGEWVMPDLGSRSFPID